MFTSKIGSFRTVPNFSGAAALDLQVKEGLARRPEGGKSTVPNFIKHGLLSARLCRLPLQEPPIPPELFRVPLIFLSTE